MYSSNFSLELSLYFLFIKASMIAAGEVKRNRSTTVKIYNIYIYRRSRYYLQHCCRGVRCCRQVRIGEYCRRETENEWANRVSCVERYQNIYILTKSVGSTTTLRSIIRYILLSNRSGAGVRPILYASSFPGRPTEPARDRFP